MPMCYATQGLRSIPLRTTILGRDTLTMKPSTLGSIRTPIVLIAIALLLSGCSENDTILKPSEDPMVESTFLPNNSEPNLLDNLIRSYVEKNIDGYTLLFDPDQFEFVFDPTDVENNPRIPRSWEWGLDWATTRNLFNHRLVLGIKLDFIKGKTTPSPADEPPDRTKIVATGVELEIDTVDPEGGENIIYKVSGDRGTFFFQSYPDELIDGQPRQRIVEWRDERVGLLLPTELKTWGQIKNVWR